jgi:hypothetical protein
MLAYIQLTSKINENKECKLFTQFSTKEFIDIRCIDHCVGFSKIGNQYYIFDRENIYDDSEWKDI